MLVVDDPKAYGEALNQFRKAGKRVGFVPTMGALHEGHLTLVREAQKKTDVQAVSIFVNPLQFGKNEDLDKYPRTLEEDLKKLDAVGTSVVFTPTPTAMYPEGFVTNIHVDKVSEHFEGKFRPGHFDGVATVVNKLFNLTGACSAFFGQKDYQQLQLIKTMVRDLAMQVEVVGVPTVRESDGLAMSSRNRYLSSDERVRALAMHRGLQKTQTLFDSGERDAEKLEHVAREEIAASFDAIDYVTIADQKLMQPIQGDVTAPAVMVITARLGKTRLLDNLELIP